MREEKLGFQLILYHGDAMLTIGLRWMVRDIWTDWAEQKNSPYLSQIDIFLFSVYLKHSCEIT